MTRKRQKQPPWHNRFRRMGYWDTPMWCEVHYNGIEVKNSWQTLYDEEVIEHMMTMHTFYRSKRSIKIEWALHTICYRLHIKRERSKDAFFEYGGEWFNNLFKKG